MFYGQAFKIENNMKRNHHLVTLSWEHHEALKIALQVKNDLKKNDQPKHLISYVLKNYHTILRHHFEQEEKSLVDTLKPFSQADDLISRMLLEPNYVAVSTTLFPLPQDRGRSS